MKKNKHPVSICADFKRETVEFIWRINKHPVSWSTCVLVEFQENWKLTLIYTWHTPSNENDKLVDKTHHGEIKKYEMLILILIQSL